MKFSNLLERLNYKEIKNIEQYLDKFFNENDIDLKFSGHFKKRIIRREIEKNELIDTFLKLYSKYKQKIKRDNYKAFVFNISNYLGIPIVIEYNKSKDMFNLYPKTVFKNDEEDKMINTAKKNDEDLLKV
jgi:hypothetical protein